MRETRAHSGAESLSVIVIDDEPDVAAYLAAVLERHGHRTETARNAAEGFELVKRLRPDVACIDIVMPEETGTALLRRIRADRDIGDTAVVFITALKPEMAPSNGGPPGETPSLPDEYIEKPPNADAFVAAVERAALSRRVKP
jgi:two-component system phosphate regulon response regulator PhoB